MTDSVQLAKAWNGQWILTVRRIGAPSAAYAFDHTRPTRGDFLARFGTDEGDIFWRLVNPHA